MHAVRRPRILLADDHTLMAEALRHLLQDDFDVVGTVADGRALLKAAEELRPELVVVDINMPLLNGLDAGEQIKALRPDLKVIYLTQSNDPKLAREAFRRKASGYLLKDSAASELTAAIRTALAGGHCISPRIAAELPEDWLKQNSAQAVSRELTLREREVLQLIAEGKSMKEVGAVLDISPRTVEFHKYRIMELLGVRTTAELTQYAIKHGLITP
jgi:DNA-binding NarL/FixJ family response regulator